jgi:hypothetical protein
MNKMDRMGKTYSDTLPGVKARIPGMETGGGFFDRTNKMDRMRKTIPTPCPE